MSNEHTHDPQEPTGARLTEAQLGAIAGRARGHKASTNDVHALLADRAALVAEVARLQDRVDAFVYLAGKQIERQEAAEAQVAAMRPLVEAHANLVDVNIDDELACAACERWLGPGKPHAPDCSKVAARALVATWQPPAAPRLTGGERIQALRDAQATPPTGEITAIMVSRDSELTEPPVAPDTAATAANRQRYPHFGLVWTVIDAVAAGDNERARAYADLLADHLDADYPYEAKRIRNRLSPDYDPGPLLYLMAETPAAPTPDAPTPAHYIRMDGGIAEAQGGMLYTTDCDFSEPEWVALLALMNEGHDNLTWEEIEPLVAARVEANAAPTPEPDWRDDADELKWLHDPDAAPDGPEGGDA